MPKVLAFIPARLDSKRIPRKNIRDFAGAPLLSYTIKQALASRFVDRVLVSTESPVIAKMAKKYGAEVPFLRPPKLAADKSDIIDTIFYTLNRLKKEEGYEPTHLLILQATSPLRRQKDIADCFALMAKTKATTVLTVCPTHPKLYNLIKDSRLKLVNGSEAKTSRTQAWPKAYLLNGCVVYLLDIKALYREKRIITKNTRAVIMPKWRSIDLDDPEEWAMAELLYKNQKRVEKIIKKIAG